MTALHPFAWLMNLLERDEEPRPHIFKVIGEDGSERLVFAPPGFREQIPWPVKARNGER